MSNFLSDVHECDLTVETIISQLVKIALKQKASAIAVRFDCEKQKLQVVDNSCGYTKSALASIFKKKNGVTVDQENLFEKIRCASYAIMITSKHELSSHTYVQVADKSQSKLIKGHDRPSKGTTVTILRYKSLNWIVGDKNHSISYMLGAMALLELEVSFSLRNDNEDKIIFSVSNPHNPWAVLKQMKTNQYSEKNVQSVKNRKVDYKTKSNEVSKQSSTLSLLSTPPPKRPLDQTDSVLKNDVIISPLSAWSNWTYKPKPLVIPRSANVNCDIFFSSNVLIDVSNDACLNLSQLSVWSDWTYDRKQFNFNNANGNPQYKFPPVSQNFNNYPKLSECRISSNTINSIQIIKQINSEFIAAVANENGKKLLIIIDQHAVHERIRYEWLIETYRKKDSHSYISERLYQDLLIPDIDSYLLKLIRYHKEVPMRVGINVKAIVGSNACIVDAVPKCFVKSKRIYNDENEMHRLMKNVRQLLVEVAKGLTHNVLPPILPITINNVIASEACRGAIKFGDPLTVKECTLLVQALQDTKAPTRCAHGRPSIVPLLDLKDLEKQRSFKNKPLNFASLKKIKS